ncbi:polysaccharide deacetylase family protein [Ruegeria sp. 2012CJ41-6]|uniref:Polysaccharide deacetylase family protein n=1 Tax=Ruegeria spongiae TaxID=2942209 RepID=A0ABT0Q1U3_9RHOB|nr:polysaccharide deacetylase family protein [Ruegeria spongiae]MCL6283790.1 polysaccharide deacetylase family protein [Ruegeria spongiae]
MTPDWTPLDAELALWQRADLTLPLWWRDDDATAPTPALDRLHDLSVETGLPVHLAVVPEPALPALADVTRDREMLIPVVHGWAHRNHQNPDSKKSEFGADRSAELALDDAQRGLTRMRDLFGDDLIPMFVPPWNRISEEVIAGLPRLGYSALSTFMPRNAQNAAPGLERINTHLDPIDWRGTRGLVNANTLITQVTAQLRDRREGRVDNGEPYGLLTHHLVHDDAIWQFTQELVTRLIRGPGQPWTMPRQ